SGGRHTHCVPERNRRRFLAELAATVAGAIFAGVATAKVAVDASVGMSSRGGASPPTPAAVIRAATPSATPAQTLLPPPSPATRMALPGRAVLTRLPGQADLLALTLDDGANIEVARLYTPFARDTGARL